MARQPLDVRAAAQVESFRIRMNSIAPGLRGSFTRLSRVERLFYFSVTIAVIFMAIAIVFVRMKTLEFKSSTDQMRIEMANTQTEINQYQQEINNLTAQGKVGTAASSANMTNGNSPTYKVTK
ncbi:MAG: hypothetical protein LBI11_04180 [Streptococcaceae bacterium]|jgi:cell division protein FtsL|nr:hypothetical protein [Streptococcaceae bacterium]